MSDNFPTREELCALFSYEPDTGLLRRKTNRPPRWWSGQICGGIDRLGYARVNVNGKKLACHRIAFLIHFGWMPKEIDHADGNRSNNAASNLRAASRSLNMANRKVCSRNTSGFKGVNYRSENNKWAAQVGGGKNRKFLGAFDTAEDAARAYNAAAIEMYGEFALLNDV